MTPRDCPIFLVENDGEHGERARVRGQRVTLPSCAAASEPSPMPIRQYLEGDRFDAETVRLMGVAFAMAVVTLQQRRRIDPLRDSVAHKIIELAKAGERDPERLCDGALKATQPMAPVLIRDPDAPPADSDEVARV